MNVYLNDIADYQGMNEVYKGRFGKKPRRPKDDFRPRRNAERLDNDIDSAQGTLYGSHLKRVVSHFFQFCMVNRNSGGPR